MGNFFLGFTLQSYSGFTTPDGTIDELSDPLQIIGPGQGVINYIVDGNWYLDIDEFLVAKNINQLPSGFTITNWDLNDAENPTNLLNGLGQIIGEISFTPTSIDVPHLPILAPIAYSIIRDVFVGNTFEQVPNPIIAGDWATAALGGTYELISYTWTLEKNEENNTIEITSDEANPDLTTIEEIILEYEVGSDEKRVKISTEKFITWTVNFLVIPIPATCDVKGLVRVIAVITGVEHEITTIELV